MTQQAPPYEVWRISYQSSEKAARAAYARMTTTTAMTQVP